MFAYYSSMYFLVQGCSQFFVVCLQRIWSRPLTPLLPVQLPWRVCDLASTWYRQQSSFVEKETVGQKCMILVSLFFGCVGSSLLHAGFLQLWRAGATLCCSAQSSHCGGFSCCGARALGVWASVVAACGLSSWGTWVLECSGFSSCGTWAQQLWHTGLVALQHVRSSQTRDRTHVPCLGRWILNHCTTGEFPRV